MKYLLIFLILLSTSCLAKVNCDEYASRLYKKRQNLLSRYLRACDGTCINATRSLQKKLYDRDQKRLQRAGCPIQR